MDRDDLDAMWDAGEQFLASLPHDYVILSCPSCREPHWAGAAGTDTQFGSDASPRMLPGDPPRMSCECGVTAPPVVEQG